MQNGADNSNTYHDHFLPCDSLFILYIKSYIKKFMNKDDNRLLLFSVDSNHSPNYNCDVIEYL